MLRKATFSLSYFNPQSFVSIFFTRYLSQSSDHSQSPNSPNLKTLCSKGHLKEALLQMAIRGLENVLEDYDTILTECINQRSTREGQRVHTHMIKTHYDPSPYLSTEPNEFTFASILTSCVGPSGFVQGRQVHSLVIQSSFESHIFVGSSLLDMYAKAGRIHEARGVFDCLPERNVVSCTAMISSYAQLGLDEEALKLFQQLQKEGMDSDYVTYASLLTSLSGLAALNHGRQVHGYVLRSELPFNVVLQNSLIDMYSKCGNLTYSRRVFDNTSERDVISWNAMIMGWEEVRNLREMMKKKAGTKDPGRSWIELDQTLHTFHASVDPIQEGKRCLQRCPHSGHKKSPLCVDCHNFAKLVFKLCHGGECLNFVTRDTQDKLSIESIRVKKAPGMNGGHNKLARMILYQEV
ncbi:Pentatricopeptide repeat, partial [Dillenia turbinata]